MYMFANFKEKIILIKKFYSCIMSYFPMKSDFGYCASNVQLRYPLRVDNPKNVFFYENTKLRDGLRIINSPSEKVVIKEYSVLASNVTIVTGNHTSTVSIPQILLGSSHVNDKSANVIIEEDVWVGTRVTILSGTKLGRGCIVGAGALVNKEVPPYAVVVGIPAKIVAVKFSLEQIIKHEKAIYPESKRLSEFYLKELFDKFFKGKKIFGVSDGIDDDARIRIDAVKKRIKYVD